MKQINLRKYCSCIFDMPEEIRMAIAEQTRAKAAVRRKQDHQKCSIPLNRSDQAKGAALRQSINLEIILEKRERRGKLYEAIMARLSSTRFWSTG